MRSGRVVDPDAEVRKIQAETVAEGRADEGERPVLPRHLCEAFSPRMNWAWVTGFSEATAQMVVEQALPHYQGSRVARIAPNESVFLALVFIRLGYPLNHIAEITGLDAQQVNRAVEKGIVALGACFAPFTTFRPLPRLSELVSDTERALMPPRALESQFVVDGKHILGRIYGPRDSPESYYSWKLRAVAYQFQCVVTHSGHCVHVTEPEPAGTHDITVYRRNRPMLLAGLRVAGVESPVILADLGHRAADTPELCVPSTPSPAMNGRRLIVEHYFGRMERVFAACRRKFNLRQSVLAPLIKALCYLTNVSVFYSPLKEDEYIFHRQLVVYASKEAERRRNEHTKAMRKAREVSAKGGQTQGGPVSFSLGEFESLSLGSSPSLNTNK